MSDERKRVDAHLASLGYCSRSEAKAFLKRHRVCVDGERVFDVKSKALHSQISIDDAPLDPPSLTLLMHKPQGVICSHDEGGKLIYSLLPQCWQRRTPKLSTVGRLDADTTGAILITDDGALNHRLTSPKNDITKLYEVTLAQPLRGDEERLFASGELLLHGEKKALLPAKMTIISEKLVHLEIQEGKYHQVKRMFGTVQNRVVKLHRLRFGEYDVADLAEGEYKIL